MKESEETPLRTFGAVLGFAAEIALRAAEFYRSAGELAQDPVLRELLGALASEEKKNRSLMEQARRENVTEMILEPISGLSRDDYQPPAGAGGGAGDLDLRRAALSLEERGQRFFRDAAAKVPLPEVARIFGKIAKKKEGTLARLKEIKISG